MQGSSLDRGDIDGDGHYDLIVGSPYAKSNNFESGEIWIFLASKSRTKGQILGKQNVDWSTAGTTIFDWFGYKSAVGVLNNKRIVFVGAPLWNNGTNTYGKLYAFDITEFNTTGNSISILIGLINQKRVPEKLPFYFQLKVQILWANWVIHLQLGTLLIIDYS